MTIRRTIIALILLLPAAGQGEIPQFDGHEHLGVQSCAASSCHGSAGERNTYGVLQNEYITWARHDLHSKAYKVLLNEQSRSIAANLGLESAHTAKVCLDCHADYVPRERRGLQYQLSDGVSCEACHGGAEKWLGVHIGGGGDKHAESLAAGLYPTEDPEARAGLCLSCHLGTRNKFATHEIMGAGHPRLSFDLQKFTDLQPRHYRVDGDYRARKTVVEDTRAWAIGQVVASRQYLALLQGPRLAAGGMFPELGLFDCHACHHSMKDLRWQPDERSVTPPGTVMLNDSSLAMSLAVARAVLPRLAGPLHSGIRELHLGARRDAAALRGAAAALDRPLVELLAELKSRRFDDAANRQVMETLAGGLKAERYADYSDAEQATMALDVFAGITGQYRDEVDALYVAMANEDRFRPAALRAAFGAGPSSPAGFATPVVPPAAAPVVLPEAAVNRSVSATALRVRASPAADAPVLTRVYFGDVVVELETRGDWSRIQFDDVSGSRTGWVASRFLR